MKLIIATDAWLPQVNGVVRSLATTIALLRARGLDVELIEPSQFRTMPMPGYPEIRLALFPGVRVRRKLRQWQPDIVHIATEGPIGWAVRRWCIAHAIPFTTAFHTRFPDYAAVRTGLSPEWFWPIMRRFHSCSQSVLVSTHSLKAELSERGIGHAALWSRGVDHGLFTPQGPRLPAMARLPRPVLLTVGRMAVEKNVEAFLRMPIIGSKVVVGDGPHLEALKRRFPDAFYLGALHGETLASAYRSADAFIFPSHTDTFGLVMIEALASGTPVAGFPVAGPLDVVGRNGRGPQERLIAPVGATHADLAIATERALACSRDAVAAYGRSFDWDCCTDQFLDALHRAIGAGARAAPPAPAAADSRRAAAR